jgi:hypothetical protein
MAISLHGQGISLDCIEFSNMLLVVLFYLVLKRYLLATAAGVIVPRVIAVGQHCSSAPRNPFLSQRLKCETTGRSATAPDLDDEGSPRGAAYRYTHIGRGHNATLNILS